MEHQIDRSATTAGRIDAANREAIELICSADPVLVDVKPAGDALEGLDRSTVLTSGAPLPWDRYTGGQRRGVIGGALFERLARDPQDADRRLRSGDITVAGCQDYACVGSLAGITTASMPVLIVEDANSGHRGYCTLFEGSSPARLNYGIYNDTVRDNLLHIEQAIAPALGDAVRRAGGISLAPIIRRAMHMGDELHSRNTAATLLFTRELLPQLTELAAERHAHISDLISYLGSGDYFFLRASMAAAKVTMDRAAQVEFSTVVTAMAFSCSEFAIRVAGLGDEWFRGPLPTMETGTLFEGFTTDDIEFMGESPITECSGLGGFAQAAAFPLQGYQGGSAQRMITTNLEMYRIAVAEHAHFKIPYFDYRGVPVGIDLRRVIKTGITPAMDIGVAGRGGGQIGAGCFRAALPCFEAALAAFESRYGQVTA